VVAFAPDGKSLLIAGNAEIHRWSLATGTPTAHWTIGRFGMITSLAVSPDGKSVAWSGTWDGSVHLLDAATGKDLRLFEAGGVSALAFSANAKRLVTGGANQVRVWNLATGMDLTPIDAPAGAVNALAFSQDGKNLLSQNAGGPVHRWDTASGRQLLDTGRSPVPWAVRAWESATGRRLAKLADAKALAGPLAFSANGKVLASHGPGAQLSLWDTEDGHELRRLGKSAGVAHLALSPDGKVLAAASEYRKVRLWDTATGAELAAPPSRGMDPPLGRHFAEPYTGRVVSTYSPDGKVLAYSKDPRTVGFWDTTTQQELWFLADDKIVSVVIAPAGQTAAVGESGRRVRFYDTVTGKELQHIKDVDSRLIAFGPDGKFVALAHGTSVRLIDLASGKDLRRFAGHQGAITVLVFAPDGGRLASGSWDSTAVVWDVSTGAGPHFPYH
jgi:WD40 repeat protein